MHTSENKPFNPLPKTKRNTNQKPNTPQNTTKKVAPTQPTTTTQNKNKVL
jgi:hypothetical protein